ncbi:MAG: fatty acid hydroxylase family protein [Verrucomicrobiaceae bacterium]|nr:fatty acid hydroxylase family protein [Verrucomicrobiaceae bacterium]
MSPPVFLAAKVPDFLTLVLGITLETTLRYAVFAGLGWLLGYVWFKRRWWKRKIIERLPTSAEVWREVRYSSLTLLVFGLVGALTSYAYFHGYTQMYRKIGQYGWPWFFLSIGLCIILHDTYFYWTHRMMHHRKLFRLFHRVHHLSTNPSPWASYSFAPLEAVVEAGIFPLAVTVMPMHPLAFAVFMVWQISFNVLGHTGYEIHPPWLMDTWMGKFINTPTNHIMHHEKMRGNYGLYFNVWDRLMGTNHVDYEKRFREVTSRKSHVASAPELNRCNIGQTGEL